MSRRRMIALLLLSALALSVVLFLLRSPAPVGGQLRERGEMAAAIGGELAGAARVQLDILSAEDRAEVEEMLEELERSVAAVNALLREARPDEAALSAACNSSADRILSMSRRILIDPPVLAMPRI